MNGFAEQILKTEIELEYNNPKPWTAKHALPFQG
jgi:hypothetical protein